MTGAAIHETVSGRELVAMLYRLAVKKATGLFEVARPMSRGRVLVLCRGQLVVSPRDEGKEISRDLRRLAAEPKLRARFDGGVSAYPPGHRRLALDGWAFAHFESSLSGSGAAAIAAELAGMRIALRDGLAPAPERLDETGKRLLSALAEPRRADELPGAARAPRFRTLAFLFALDGVGALVRVGALARVSAEENAAASRALGVPAGADRVAVKRAYRRLARALHPDLRPGDASDSRRALEQKLAVINRAYRVLLRS